MSKFIADINIGELNDLSKLIPNSPTAQGCYRIPRDYVLRLVEFYLSINKSRSDKLKTFSQKKKKFEDTFQFVLAISGDGAPGAGTSILISFINTGKRIASSKENFLLFGGHVEENSVCVSEFLKILFNDIQFLESKVFNICGQNVEFELGEISLDMKMLTFVAGELSNSATYFSSFANVRNDETNNFNKTYGTRKTNQWKPWDLSLIHI